MTTHLTTPEFAVLHPAGWIEVPGTGKEITVVPVLDSRHVLADGRPVLGRLMYRDAAIDANRYGATLITRETILALKASAETVVVEPVTMAHTQSLAGSLEHDRKMWDKLEAKGWSPEAGVCALGMGKHHQHGAPPGRCWLMGWWTERLEWYTEGRRGPGWIQEGSTSGPGPHSDGLFDYASTTIYERPIGTVADTDPAPDTEPPDTDGTPDAPQYQSLGEAVVAMARRHIGHRETSKNDSPLIREWAKPYGLGGGINWCAVFVADAIRDACAAMSVPMPIVGSPGAQATMAQFRAAGLWKDRVDLTAADLAPGFVPIWDRSDSRPETSWWGHIGIGTGGDFDARTFGTVEGNAGPTGEEVFVGVRGLDDIRLLGFGRLGKASPGTELGGLVVELAEALGPEPVREGDPLDPGGERMYAQWLGLPYLADSVTGYDDSEPVIAGDVSGIDVSGIDVSAWQDPARMHWDAFAARHTFLVARATYGIAPDRRFAAFSEAMRDGVTFGAYHFLRGNQPWGDQLDAFCAALDSVGYGVGDLLPALDIERNDAFDGGWNPSRILAYAEHLAEVLTQRYGGCIIYTSPSVNTMLGYPDLFARHPLWIADYGDGFERDAPRWGRDWQHADKAKRTVADDWAIWQHAVTAGPEYGDSPRDLLDRNVARRLPLIG